MHNELSSCLPTHYESRVLLKSYSLINSQSLQDASWKENDTWQEYRTAHSETKHGVEFCLQPETL